MARLARAELFDPSEIAVIHVIGRVVQDAYLLGVDPQTGKSFEHRKEWIESAMGRASANFGIDLIAYSLMSTHIHLVLRSRPDQVKKWDDTEVARRWLMLCPIRKNKDGSPKEPRESELNTIRNNASKVKEIRERLSDISWFMRWLCQRIGQRANRESKKSGNFWQSRYRAIRLLDEASILACAAYVDLNPIRAALAETLEESLFTSARLRTLALQQQLLEESEQEGNAIADGVGSDDVSAAEEALSPVAGARLAGPAANSGEAESRPTEIALCDSFLVPVQIIDGQDDVSPMDSQQETNEQTPVSGQRSTANRNRSRRCSNKGFTTLSTADYLQLLDWTARQIVRGKRGSTPEDAPPIFQRLDISIEAWCELVYHFRDYFCHVAGKPQVVDAYRSRQKGERFRIPKLTREVLATS